MKVKFELDANQVNYILGVLAKQPYDQVCNLIADVMKQVAAQEQK